MDTLTLASLVLAGALWVGILSLQLADLVLSSSGIGVARPVSPSYESLLVRLEASVGTRLGADQVDEYRELLDNSDARVAARANAHGRGATAHLWRETPLRLVPVAVSLAVPGLAWVYLGSIPVSLASLALVAVSYVLALAGARASLASRVLRAAVDDVQRAEVERLLALAQRSSRKRVVGLGERVNRALQILREQQD